MSPAKRRKTQAKAKADKKLGSVPAAPNDEETTTAPDLVPDAEPAEEAVEPPSKEPGETSNAEAPSEAPQEVPPPPPPAEEKEDPAAKVNDRLARFKALQARAKTSSEKNLKEATLESQRLATDPTQLTALHRQRDIAAHKLLKADVEEAGGDFERKRAWDWTIDESERWDKRMRKKEAHRDNNAFQSYHAEGNKTYKRQLRNVEVDRERYERDRAAAIERAAAAGGLDIVETEDGELIAVDRDGSFYSTADSTAAFAQNRPDKAAVDRLVADMRRAEEQRLKKRRERMAQNGDDGDTTYINEKNKQFNMKLARFYNKYTAEIRDSFERGTMI